MDTSHTTAIRRICCIIIFYFISKHKSLTEAVTLEFCQSTDHTTNNTTETGVIKSPGFGTEVRNPSGVPNRCTIYITVCSGCRFILTNTSTNDCVTTDSCFLRRASVTLEGFPMKTIFFNSASAVLDVTSDGRSVTLVFQKNPYDAVTGQFGFYIHYKVRKPELTRFAFDPTRRFGTISSPGFPNRYASNGDTFMYQLEAAPGSNYYLTLRFSDWYLSKYSKVTIQTGSRPTAYDRLSDRPIVTNFGQSILITFETGTGDTTQNYIGFKATYNYSYGPPDDSKTAQAAGIDFFDSVYGGAINFAYPGRGVVDHVWVIPRSDLISSNGTRLKLRIDSTTNLPVDALEIRSGPTSEAAVVSWLVGHSLSNELGFYLRLRSRVRAGSAIAFSAVFVSTGIPNTWAFGGGQCRSTEFVCRDPLECLKSKDLYCDGIRHCDGATDEIGCTATSKPCSSYWVCQRTQQRPICITRRCDGIRDCQDGTDEFNCPPSTLDPLATTTWHQSDDDHYTNYNTLSIALPLVMLGIIIVIIVSFIVCIAIRRKRHLSVIRRTLHNEAPPGELNTDRNAHYRAHFTPNPEIASPPSYGEIVFNNNQGFTTSPGQPAPPPYEEIAKPLASAEPSAPPPPYLLSEETASMQPPREIRTSPRHSGEQRTSPRHSGEQRTSPRHSGEQRTSPRHSGEQRTGGSTDALISGNDQC